MRVKGIPTLFVRSGCLQDKIFLSNPISQQLKHPLTTPPYQGGLRCSEMVRSSCSTSGTCHVAPVTNPVISNE